ncbi:MAG: hypothetical protein M3N32_07980 [Actinomycetota bacterium]|nr:hypothetical protein [Actinomycetota bacterium]
MPDITAREALDRAIATAVRAEQKAHLDELQALALLAQAWATIADYIAWYDEGGDGDDRLLCQACEEHYSQASIFQDDLAELLNLLGLGTHARPKSPHHVFVDEVLPALRRLVADGGDRDRP